MSNSALRIYGLQQHYVKNVKIHQCDFIKYKINIIKNIIDLCYNIARITNVKNNVKIMFTIYIQ